MSRTTLDALKDALRAHPLYSSVRSIEDLRFFMEHHVVCVWDFMSLLKSLQRALTGVSVPWLPAGDPEAARLVNEIVLAEESDTFQDRGRQRTASHFEWYIEAMEEVGCDMRPIGAFLYSLRFGETVDAAFDRSGLPRESVAFSRKTFEVLSRPLHVQAAVFLHGREDVIPQMFLPFVRSLEQSGLACRLLHQYLERHVAIDGEQHGPQSEQVFVRLCGGDPARLQEGERAAAEALLARKSLWDAIVQGLASRRPVAAST